ncbi:MAG: L-serine ammonia-lyase [Erysipelothrix sp.]|nr:L-serine ammonia-lyase [Erysipelothrix sp.]
MESLREMYKAGYGPSSSHTLAPMRACLMFKEITPDATRYEVELYGSLALTGKGHYTDEIILKTLAPIPTQVKFCSHWEHEDQSGLILKGFDAADGLIKEWVVFSIGGGSIKVLNEDFDFQRQVYPHESFNDIVSFCKAHNMNLAQYVYHFEPDIKPYLSEMLDAMFKSVYDGINTQGVLPGPLQLVKVARDLWLKANSLSSNEKQKRLKLVAYAYAANEQNASNQIVVTAPTMGACGVMASFMYYAYHDLGFSKHRLVDAMAVAGIIGNLIKHNATISGAVGGCQAEVGSATSMTAAAKAFLDGHSLKVIEVAAEIAMEHHLGLTCDPIGGFVMIPCIERNGAAILRAFDAVFMAENLSVLKDNFVQFDDVIATMNYTGSKIAVELKETSLGGLATIVRQNKKTAP